jgi:hypothetical protein
MMTQITDTAEQRDRGGRFVIGGKAGPGRPRGARSKLSELFLEDLRDAWQTHGKTALEKCAVEEPAQFLRTIASLIPKQAEVDVGVSVFHDVRGVVEAYRMASELLGVDPQRGIRRLKQIEHDDDVFQR